MDYEKKKEIIGRIVHFIDEHDLLCQFESIVKDDCSMVFCSQCEKHVENAMLELIRSDADKFVDEHGGLEAVKSKLAYDKTFRMFTGALRTRDELEKEIQKLKDEKAEVIHTNLEFFEKLIKTVGIDEEPLETAKERLFEELDKRLMPKGMEWPKFEDGEKVDPRSCKEKYSKRNGETHALCGVQFVGKDVFICDGNLGNNLCLSSADITIRAKRGTEKIYDADGVEIKIGDKLYMVDDDAWKQNGISKTQERGPFTVTKIQTDIFTRIRANSADEEEGTDPWYIIPKTMTHKQPDSWEKLENDAYKDECEYFGFDGKPCRGCPAYNYDICRLAVIEDIIKRAKALSERNNNE